MKTLSSALRLRPSPFTLQLAALSALAGVLVMVRQADYGVALTWDSVNYISVARNLLSGAGFTTFEGIPYESFGPLYPLLLAAAGLGIFDPHDVAGPLNAVIFGATVFVAGKYLETRLESRFLLLWGCAFLAFAVPLTFTAFFAMSESAFSLFALLALVQTDKFMDKGRLSSLLWASGFTALAFLTHYQGIALVPVVALLLLSRPAAVWAQRLKPVFVYASIALAPMCLWMLRNLLLYGAPAGPRGHYPSHSLTDTLDRALLHLADWVSPNAFWGYAGLLVLAVIVILGLVLMRARGKEEARTHRRAIFMFGGFALVHVAALAVSGMIGTYFRLEPRYLTVVYIPLMFLVLTALDPVFSYARERRPQRINDKLRIPPLPVRGGRLAAPILIALLSLSLVYQAGLNLRQIDVGHYTWEYGAYRWAGSDSLGYLREESIDGVVFSNHAAGAYIHTGPTTSHRYIRCPAGLLPRLSHESEGSGREVYVLWFNGVGSTWCHGRDYGVSDLLSFPELEPVAFLDDGFLFRFDDSPTAPADPYRLHRAEYESLTATEPVVRSTFDVYRDGDKLTYVKEPCSMADTEAMFFLHVYPVDESDLAEDQRQWGFNNLDFRFGVSGRSFDGGCTTIATLPGYPIDYIRTGQYVAGEGRLWEELFPPAR